MNEQYPYGKAHHERYVLTKRIVETFHEYIQKIESLGHVSASDYRVHNVLIELRNLTCSLVAEAYQEMKTMLTSGVRVSASKRSPSKFREPRITLLDDKSCAICSENRAIDLCHIIPRELGGKNDPDNYVFLCPTHHFLFDQARLKKEEVERISLEHAAEDAKQYFDEVRLPMLQMYWIYGTNKFKGCNCGDRSGKFQYVPVRNGNVVSIGLQCVVCNERWLNVWPYGHPITRASVEAFSLYEAQLGSSQDEERYQKAEEKLRIWIREHLASVDPEG